MAGRRAQDGERRRGHTVAMGAFPILLLALQAAAAPRALPLRVPPLSGSLSASAAVPVLAAAAASPGFELPARAELRVLDGVAHADGASLLGALAETPVETGREYLRALQGGDTRAFARLAEAVEASGEVRLLELYGDVLGPALPATRGAEDVLRPAVDSPADARRAPTSGNVELPVDPALAARARARVAELERAGEAGHRRVPAPALTPDQPVLRAGVPDHDLRRATLDGEPAMVKTGDERRLLQEARFYELAGELGVLNAYRGLTRLDDGRLALVMSDEPGALVHSNQMDPESPPLAGERAHADIWFAGARLRRADVAANDLQFIVRPDGRAVLIDPELFALGSSAGTLRAARRLSRLLRLGPARRAEADAFLPPSAAGVRPAKLRWPGPGRELAGTSALDPAWRAVKRGAQRYSSLRFEGLGDEAVWDAHLLRLVHKLERQAGVGIDWTSQLGTSARLVEDAGGRRLILNVGWVLQSFDERDAARAPALTRLLASLAR